MRDKCVRTGCHNHNVLNEKREGVEMKNVKQLLATAALVLTALPALHAQTLTHSVRATIPFEFTVNGKMMSPGDYTIVSSDEKVITIKSLDGNGLAVV